MRYLDLLAKLHLDKETEAKFVAVAEQAEREQRAKQRAGIEVAKENGIVFGRPRAEVQGIDRLYRKYMEHEITLTEAARLSGVSRSTIYRRFREQNEIVLK